MYTPDAAISHAAFRCHVSNRSAPCCALGRFGCRSYPTQREQGCLSLVAEFCRPDVSQDVELIACSCICSIVLGMVGSICEQQIGRRDSSSAVNSNKCIAY